MNQLTDTDFQTFPSPPARIMMRQRSFARWSQLTIFLARNRALCSHEGQTERRARGSVPHLWRETRRKV